jgi:hypothetical protein
MAQEEKKPNDDFFFEDIIKKTKTVYLTKMKKFSLKSLFRMKKIKLFLNLYLKKKQKFS